MKRRTASKRGAGDDRQGFILRVIDGLNPGKEYFFDQACTIGRVESNDIVLVEPGVSRNHCRMSRQLAVYFIEDLGSANGTRLNGEQLEAEECLRDGDYITLGQTTLQFSQLDMPRGDVTSPSILRDREAKALDSRTKTGVAAAAVSGLLASRRGKLLALAALVLFASGVAFALLKDKQQIVLLDQSNVTLSYSEEDAFFNAVFGYGNYDQTHLNQLRVAFEYLGGRVTLQYGAWGVDKMGEVKILLNETEVGEVPLTMNRWVYGLKQVLPREKLQKGKTNHITFRNTLNPGASEAWEICYLQILQEAIPPPDPQEARYHFDLAKKSWEDREIEPSNMYTALTGFKKARDLLEGLAERPELYQEALDNIELVDRALTRKFADGLFSARRAEKLDKDPYKARSLLSRTMKYFNREDFRYRELSRYQEQLAEQWGI